MGERNYGTEATVRVDNSEALSAYRDLIIGDGFSEDDKHFEWVANAPEEELLDWAQNIRKEQEEGKTA